MESHLPSTIARRLHSTPPWSDEDGVKLYGITSTERALPWSMFRDRLKEVKATRSIVWKSTPAFAIFHDGVHSLYLVLAWWSNDNELFTSISVLTEHGWLEDAERYSFCLFDMEIMWHERAAFLQHLYLGNPDLSAYRASKLEQAYVGGSRNENGDLP